MPVSSQLIITGKEMSPTYSLIFRHGIVNTLKVYDGYGTMEMPLFNTVSITDKNKSEVDVIKIAVDSNSAHNKLLPIVDESNGAKTNLKVNKSGTYNQQVAYRASLFTTPTEYGFSYFNQTRYYSYLANKISDFGVFDYGYKYYATDAYNTYNEYSSVAQSVNYNEYKLTYHQSGIIAGSGVSANSISYSTIATASRIDYYSYYYCDASGETFDSTYYAYGRKLIVYGIGMYASGYSGAISHTKVNTYYTVYGSEPTYGTLYCLYNYDAYHIVHNVGVQYTASYANYVYKSFTRKGTYAYEPSDQYINDAYTAYRYYYHNSFTSYGYTAKEVTTVALQETATPIYAGLYRYNSGGTTMYDRGYISAIMDNYTSPIQYIYTTKYQYLVDNYTYGHNAYPVLNTGHPIAYYDETATERTKRQVYSLSGSVAYDYYSYYRYDAQGTFAYSYINGIRYYVAGYDVSTYSYVAATMIGAVYHYYNYTDQGYGPIQRFTTKSYSTYAWLDGFFIERSYNTSGLFNINSYNASTQYLKPSGEFNYKTYLASSGSYFNGAFSYVTVNNIPRNNGVVYNQGTIIYKYLRDRQDYYYQDGSYATSTAYENIYYHI